MSKIKVLIVEDELISARYLKRILLAEGLHVSAIADNATDALSFINQDMPDLILMDVMLNGSVSGCELAIQIRSINTEVIIIFLSAHSDEQMLEYALNANAYSYLLKPYRDSDILSTIKMALHFKKRPKIQNFIELKNGYSYDVNLKKLYQNSFEIHLSEKLSKLLNILIQNRGNAVSNEQIANSLSQKEFNINTIRSLIYRIKNKYPDLEVHSISKKGYVIY